MRVKSIPVKELPDTNVNVNEKVGHTLMICTPFTTFTKYAILKQIKTNDRRNFCVSPDRKEDTVADEFEIDLLRVCKALWKKAWAIVLCAIVLGGGVFAYSRYTYVPMYAAQTTMYIGSVEERQFAFADGNGGIIMSNVAEARRLVDSCGAVLKTQTVLEEVIRDSGVDRTSAELAGMITSKAVNNTELFKVTVTSEDPEEAAKIANSIAQVLPQKMESINCNYDIFQLDHASLPTNPVPNGIGKNAALGALLGALLVCTVIAAPDILQQYKEQKPSPATNAK